MATLYHYLDCPYCFRVRAYLAERDLTYTSLTVDRGAPPPELLALNPLGRLPIWVTDEGRPIFGSQTIVHFLEATHGQALLPTDPLQRARCAMAEELCTDGLLQPLIRLDREMAGREPGTWDLQVWQAETSRVNRTLQVFESLLGGRPWLVGQSLTTADLALVQPLTILERYGLDLQRQPGLADLAERLSRRPSIVAARRTTSPPRAA